MTSADEGRDVAVQAAILEEFKTQCRDHRQMVTGALQELTRSVNSLRLEVVELREQARSRSVVSRVMGNVIMALIGAAAAVFGAVWEAGQSGK